MRCSTWLLVRFFRWWYRNEFVVYLEIDHMPAALIIDASVPGDHSVVLTPLNLDSTPAIDVLVSYSSSNESVVLVNSDTGVLTPTGNGECVVTGTGFRGVFTHDDAAVVTVQKFGADFTVSISAS